jgi:hypothetical protein
MLDSLKKTGKLRWPPRLRFIVTEQGHDALLAYEQSIQGYHSQENQERREFDRIQEKWAQSYGVTSQDAVVLTEFNSKPLLPKEVQSSLDCCGTTLKEVQSAIDRLYLAGLLAPVGGVEPIS